MDNASPQKIIDGLAEPIMLIGNDFTVKMMNKAAREFSAIESKAGTNLYCFQVLHRRDEPCAGKDHPCPLQKVYEDGCPVTVVHEHYFAGKDKRFVEIVAAPFFGKDGVLQGIIESNRDITKRKRREIALQKCSARLQAMTARLAELEDTERSRLSRELHDQVGQNLSVLGLNLNIIRTLLAEYSEAQVHFRLDDSIQIVEQTGEQIRDIMADLRPLVLDDYGLVAALRWYSDKISDRTGIEITLDCDSPNVRYKSRLENTLYRIAQEALTNVTKHSQAKSVRITVEPDGDKLRLVIADDGIGFDPTGRLEVEGNHGWGLLIMRERVETIGGQFKIESSPNLGARIIVEVPR